MRRDLHEDQPDGPTKRVVFITGSLPPIACGVGYYAEELLRAMADTGRIDLHLVTGPGVAVDLPYPMHRVSGWRLRDLAKMVRTVRRLRPALVHLQYPAAGYGWQLGINVLPYVLRSSRRWIVAITLHEYHAAPWLGRVRAWLTVSPAQRIIVSNRADLDALPKRLRGRARIIPIGSTVPSAPARPQALTQTLVEQGLKPHKPTLLFFGFAQPSKGLPLLADILASPKLSDHQALLLTSLDEQRPYERALISMFSAANAVEKRIAWTGFLPAESVSQILAGGTSFILLQPRPLSAKSGTAITAALHGLVVVAMGGGDAATVSEPFRNDENSVLLPELSADAFSDALAALHEDPERRRRLGAGARRLAAHFAWSNIVRLHLELYEEH